MGLDTVGHAALLVDVLAVVALMIAAWQDLRQQESDTGRVGGVVTLVALAFVLYFAGRAFLDV